MKYRILIWLAAVTIALAGCASNLGRPGSSAEALSAGQSQQPNYNTGAYAQVDIERSVAETFGTLTNVNLWPQINKGVTKDISPSSVKIAKGVRFRETIASPVPGLKDWTNEWLVEDYEPGKRFVISGLDNFSSVPVYVRLTYEFAAKDANTTTYKRSIDVAVDERFAKGASKADVDALYQFLGFQREMAKHFKRYMESSD